MTRLDWWLVTAYGVGIFLLLLVVGYGFDLPIFGFSDYLYVKPGGEIEFQRGKTVWDWLQLLIVPAALAIVGFIFNRTEKQLEQQRVEERGRREQQQAEERARLERETIEDNQREAALQSYLDQMTHLLLEKNLRQSEADSEVRTIARVRTLTTLQRLDGPRCIIVFRFLHDAHLTQNEEDDSSNIVNLKEADLSHKDLQGASIDRVYLVKANLRNTNLTGAILEFVNFNKACLTDADLRGAFLLTVHLQSTDLTGADLREARLVKTHLDEAQLQNAKFDGAYMAIVFFDGADLTGATFTGARLEDVYLNETNITLEQVKQCEVVRNVKLPWEEIGGDEDYPSHWKESSHR